VVLQNSEPWGLPRRRQLLVLLPRLGNIASPKRQGLKRLYSAFPGGAPGMGLLLLRLALGVTLITQSLAYLQELQDLRMETWTVCLAALESGAALSLGC
jgi:hypothetical protein